MQADRLLLELTLILRKRPKCEKLCTKMLTKSNVLKTWSIKHVDKLNNEIGHFPGPRPALLHDNEPGVLIEVSRQLLTG